MAFSLTINFILNYENLVENQDRCIINISPRKQIIITIVNLYYCYNCNNNIVTETINSTDINC